MAMALYRIQPTDPKPPDLRGSFCILVRHSSSRFPFGSRQLEGIKNTWMLKRRELIVCYLHVKLVEPYRHDSDCSKPGKPTRLLDTSEVQDSGISSVM